MVEKIGEVGKVRWELAGEVVPPEVYVNDMADCIVGV